MTILQAFKVFVKKLTGHEPVGNNIAEVICNSADEIVSQTVLLKYEDDTNTSFVLNSSTTDSVKQFRVTVDDSGELTADEID